MSSLFYWCDVCRQYIPADIPQAAAWVQYHETCRLTEFASWESRMTRDLVFPSTHFWQGVDPPVGYSCPVDPSTLLAMAVHSMEEG